ncbi:type I polyketide synthase [Actinoallomurus soli]|uniref:type I polyketide synthase n=1 Tax=Actinoallomurus soli TaxID=2952535 RepID=UPI002093618F|nr:type I polyketide synthase [Actinoallomurus soli]MCO5973397.1 SDR family NAD(P)-dependent oxidoreductase [Actinoallomurus soli]
MAATEPGGPGPRRPGKPAIRRFLVDAVAGRCKVPAAEVDPDRPLDELGLTSRDAVAIAGELEKLVGARLPATLLYEHRTIARLADVIAQGEFSAPYGDSVNDTPPLSAVSDEPIAVIGIGCRFPGGVSGPETYWRFLLDGGDGIREVPDGRWDPFDDGTLEDVTRFGGFLDDVAGFDSRFFGITPDEADVMDPQQRLLLEVAWEAFQHAGVAPPSLRGSRTGVFVGVSAPEYGYVTGTAPLRPYTATGAALSIVANRLSYLLDLRGPSMIVDTACSSSLVATHLAVRSLRAGESDLAVAGGVNVLLSPLITKTFDLGGVTAPDGRCKPFDASADGMVRAEGCGALVLKRLSDARRDGDRVLAVVRGSAVNSDGRSTGLVAPNAEAQVAVLRAAYAGLGRPDYVEAHGTGTLLGDPIEARALGAALGGPDPDGRPVLIGSVKSNLGHLEAAAGVAGLIKVVLALAHRRIPASLHYREPNPHIDVDALGLAVAAEETPWPETRNRPALAGVSGFGFGGTNAHVVLEAAPAEDERPRRRREPAVHTLLLSDVDAGRIGPYAAGLADWLEAGDAALPDVARTLSRRFGRGRAAAAVVGRDRTALAAALRAPRITGVTVARDAPPVWVFSGYGAQRPGMGRRLLADEPAFAAAIDALDGPFAAQAGFSLWDTLESGERVTGVYRTMTTLFGLQVGLAALLRSYGAEPGAVIGHSMGEIAAAVVAGALSLEDGVTVMTCRARLLDGIAEEGGGAMLVMGCAADDALAYVRTGADVHVAVRSSPRQTVLTGDAGELARVAARATDDGLLARVVQAEGAGHSPAVDPILGPLRGRLADVRGRQADVPFYSTVLEDPREAPAFDGDYWAANARRTVRLADAVAAAAEDGFTAFVEVNAHPLLAQAITETADGALVVPTLRRPPRRPGGERPSEADDTVTFHEALATLTVHGHLPAPTPDGHVIDVPAPAWEHRRHWIDAPPRGATGLHPLLGAHVELPGEDRHVWSADVGTAASPWADRPFGHPLLPAAAYAEIALAAGTELLGPDAAVSGLHLHRPVPLDEHTTLTTSVTPADDDGATVEIHARTPAATWTPVASATVSAGPPRPADETDDLIEPAAAGRPRGDRPESNGHQAGATGARVGVPPGDGPPADGLGVAAEAEIGPAAEGNRHFRLHPEVFGRCLDAAADLLGEGAWLPESIGVLRVHGPTRHGGRCLIRLTPADDGPLVALRLVGEGGRTLAEATDIRMRSYGRTELPVPLGAKLAELTWQSADAAPAEAATIGSSAAAAAMTEAATAGTTAAGTLMAEAASAGTSAVVAPTVEESTGAGGGDPFVDAVVLAAPGDPIAGALPDGVVRETGDWAGVESLARDLVTAAEVPAHVVTLPPADLTDERLVLAVSGLVRGLTSGSVPPRLWLVTRGALRPTGTGKGDPGQAFAGAMVRVLGFETPGLRATHLDLDPDGPPDAAVEAIAAELRARPADTEIARRGGRRYVARLTAARLDGGRLDGGRHDGGRHDGSRLDGGHVDGGHVGDGHLDGASVGGGRVGGAPVGGGRVGGAPVGGGRVGDGVGGPGQGRLVGGRPRGGRPRAVVRRGAAYVISGGYGGLGLVTARLLAERGAGRIVLSGRNGPPPEAEKAISELRESGVEVEVVLGDVAVPGVAERMVAAAGERLRGVVHAAGGLADRIFTDIDAAGLRRVWGPKVDGAHRLYAATRGRDLDWWVVYSSAAALLGSPGQGAYAAANAAVDALTGSLRERGVPAYTINWGTWSRVGGAANLSGGPASGIDPITPEEGAEAFEALLAHGRPATGVLRFDPRQAVAAFPELGRMPYFSALVEALPEAEDDWPGAEALRAAEPSAARALVRGRVAERVATVLGFTPDPAQSLTDLGLDSLVAVRIKSALEHDLGLTVPATVLLQGGSVNVLTTWALTELGLADPESPAAPAAGTRPGFVDARDAAERLVIRVFERVLGADRVSATDDFFALGGREDQARTVLEILELEVGRPIDHAEPFAHPTVEHLASVIRAGEEEAARRIVRPLTPATRGRPFFCAHPAGGTTGVYRQLATLVGGPFFGLERFADAPSVEERAARYAALIREAQSAGPYRLGGWSFGGVVAYETARILGDVELLALIDAGIPRRADDPAEAAAHRYADFAAYLNETYGLGVALDVEELRPLDEAAQLALVMERAAPLMEKLPPAILHHQLTSHEDTRSLEAYRPEPYDGRVVLYRATEPTPWTVRDARYELDETNGFGDLCPRLEVVPIRGAHHLNLLDPPAVHTLAGHLGALLIQ